MDDSRRPGPLAFPALLVLALACHATPARADPLPNGSSATLCSAEGNISTDLLTCEFVGGPGVPSSAFALASPEVPAVRAEAQASVQAVLGAGSSASVFYFFAVEGPVTGVQVPLLMDVRLEASATDDSLAYARISVSTSVQDLAFLGEVCQGRTVTECDHPAALEETISLVAMTGSREDGVNMYTQAQAFINREFAQSATAFADPYIYVDPSFTDAHLYHVTVSPGFGNAPPVPEPAPLWLFVPGLLWLRWRAGRRRACWRESACAAP